MSSTRHSIASVAPSPVDPYVDLVRDLPIFDYNTDDEITFDAGTSGLDLWTSDRRSWRDAVRRTKAKPAGGQVGQIHVKDILCTCLAAHTEGHRSRSNSPKSNKTVLTEEDSNSPPVRVSAIDVPTADQFLHTILGLRKRHEEVRGRSDERGG